MPSCVHACKLAVRTAQGRRLIINIDVPMDGIYLMLALGACKFKGAGHATAASARKAPNDVRVKARLKMPRSVLLERAVSADQARPRCKLGRLKLLNSESERRAFINEWGAEAT